jgi:signal transduction histidine kinase
MDVQRIREVLMHLLENAGKYSDPRIPVKVSSEVAGDRPPGDERGGPRPGHRFI